MVINNFDVDRSGRLFKLARLHNEYYDYLSDPLAFVAELKTSKGGDIFTFLAEMHERSPKYDFQYEHDQIAVIPLTTYDNWWKNQISDKTRNMARKAAKKGLEIKVVPFDDEFVRGIMSINDETPIRQGKRYWHYKEDFETVKRLNITYLDQSVFIGAYLGTELIGYLKLVQGNQKASIMQILSKIAHRDKAPNNALIAKAVEICTERKFSFLHYAFWSRRGLGDFKINHGFKPLAVTRYYVPLTPLGRLVLGLRLHRRPTNLIPAKLHDYVVSLRESWYAHKYRPAALRPGH
jgi:hypothetical protein